VTVVSSGSLFEGRLASTHRRGLGGNSDDDDDDDDD